GLLAGIHGLFSGRNCCLVRRITCGYPWPELEGKRIWYDPRAIEVVCLVFEWLIGLTCMYCVWHGKVGGFTCMYCVRHVKGHRVLVMRDRMGTPTQYMICWFDMIGLNCMLALVVQRRFMIVYHEKVVRITVEGCDEILQVHGEQLQDKGFIRPSHFPGECYRVDVKRESWSPFEVSVGITKEGEVSSVRTDIGYFKRVQGEKSPGDMLRDLDQQMEKRADDDCVRAMAMIIQYGVRGMILAAQSEAFKQENVRAERLHRECMRMIVMDEASCIRLRWMIYLVVLADAAKSVRDTIGFEYCLVSLDRVIRFGKKGKLALRFVGPFEILERIGPVAYWLRLPEELSKTEYPHFFVGEGVLEVVVGKVGLVKPLVLTCESVAIYGVCDYMCLYAFMWIMWEIGSQSIECDHLNEIGMVIEVMVALDISLCSHFSDNENDGELNGAKIERSGYFHFSILYIDTMCCDDIHSCLRLAFPPCRGVTLLSRRQRIIRSYSLLLWDENQTRIPLPRQKPLPLREKGERKCIRYPAYRRAALAMEDTGNLSKKGTGLRMRMTWRYPGYVKR
ncbi:hypothetical protein Tco_0712118, partial [Tanacetum coccineum]